MSFLCGINGSAPVVLNYTGTNCGATMVNGADLNLPSITLAKLNQSRTIQRTLTNIGGNESYSVGWNAPYGVSMKVTPSRFYIASGEKQVLNVFLNSTLNNSVASFGRIGLFGDKSHVLNIHLSVIQKIMYNSSSSWGLVVWLLAWFVSVIIWFFGPLFNPIHVQFLLCKLLSVLVWG